MDKASKGYSMYNETLYEIERIIRVKKNKKREWCLIKWKGYDDKYNTWEPAEHITKLYLYQELPQRHAKREEQSQMGQNQSQSRVNHQYRTRTTKKPNKLYHSDMFELNRKAQLPPEAISEKEDSEDPSYHEQQKKDDEMDQKKTEDHQTAHKVEIQEKSDDKNDSSPFEVVDLKLEKQMFEVTVESLDGQKCFMDYKLLKKHYPFKLIKYFEKKTRKMLQS